jgi:hypothetical protein
MSPFRPRIGIAALVALLLITLSAGPVAAAKYQPDGRIRLVKLVRLWNGEVTQLNSSLKGNNIYNTTGKGQTVKWASYSTTPEGYSTRHVFAISLQNDGSRSDRFTVRATGTGLTKSTVKYFRGTTNITSAVVAGTYRTPTLAAGEKYVIKATVTNTHDVGYRLVRATSIGNSSMVDAVRFRFYEETCGC